MKKYKRVRTIISFAEKYKILFLVAEVCILFSYAVSLLLPLNISRLVDKVLKEGKTEETREVIAIFAGLFLISLLTNFVYSKTWQTIYNNYIVDVKTAVFKSAINARACDLNNMNSGDVMHRIDADSDEFIQIIIRNIFHFINSILLCLGVVIFICRINIPIAIFISIASFLPMLFTQLFNHKKEEVSRQHSNVSGVFNGRLFEFLKGFRDLKTSDSLSWPEKIINYTLRQLIKLGNKIKRIDLAAEKIIFFFNLSISLVVYVISANLFYAEKMSLGEFVALISYIALLHKKLNWMLRIGLDWHSRKISVDRVIEILELPSEDISGYKIASISKIKVDKITFGYGDDNVIENVSFDLFAGEKIAVVGVSGVGKTTLIGLLLKLYTPATGKIEINDIDIKKISAIDLREKYCVVSQETMLFDTSIRYNITLGKEISDEKIWKVLSKLNIKESISCLPGKLDFVFSRGNDLSGGQKQRLMIARAILKNAEIYVFDEATSALDVENEKIIVEDFFKDGTINTAIVISHKYEAIKNCAKVLVLNNGKVELFSNMKDAKMSSVTFNKLFPLEKEKVSVV